VIALLVLVAALALPGSAVAQGSGPTWVALDEQPPGTAAQVTLNTDLSSASQTFFDVSISGFYVTTRLGDDGRLYQDVSIPGLPSHSVPGEPRVPIVRVELGIVTGATGATLLPVIATGVHALPGYLVWPSPIPALMHEGTPEQFVRDSATYASSLDVPPGDGVGGVTRTALAGIPASLCTAYPVHWNPASGVLTVPTHVRFGFAHGGSLGSPLGLTREHADLASHTLFNWGTVGSDYAIDWTHFNGNFLFLCPSEWMPKIQKLIDQKKTRGFSVSVVDLPLTGVTCEQVRQSIQNWYAGTPAGNDHYCILVGSFVSAPLCSTSGQVTDKLLSSVNGDLEPEIHLGRLWVANDTDLDHQVQKILGYETQPQVNNDGNVLLVAHHEQGPYFDFQAEQETVRTASYAQVTPGFVTCYGTNPSVGNADIKNDIETGVGVAAYYGHGEPNRWDDWNWAANVSYTNTDALALANGVKTPVVWSIACSTGDLTDLTCLGAAFMRNTGGGAVAFYGAVDPIYGLTSQVLNETLFQSVYGKGITRHGLAIALAEHAVIVADSLFGFDMMIKFVLLGDPEMEIKRHNPDGVWLPLDIFAPATLFTPCPGADCCPSCPAPTVDIQVTEASGLPKSGVKVGVWKPAAGGDELLDNRYTGSDGWVHIPAPMVTPGQLYYGWDDGDGRSGLDSIEVRPLAGVDGSVRRPLVLRPVPSVTAAGTQFVFGSALVTPGRVTIFGVDGRRVRSLDVPAGASTLDWNGRDAASRPVAPGAYVVRLEAGALRASGRVAVVR
jgi:peptidase C25-like protein